MIIIDKEKKKFLDKLRKQSKEDIIKLVIEALEENFILEQKLNQTKHVCFSHEIVLKSILSHVAPVNFEIEEVEEETPTDKPKEKESLRSYA